MKRLFVLLVIGITFASCSDQDVAYSGPMNDSVDDRDVPFRAHKTWLSTVTYDRFVDHNVKIIYADSAYRDGDTISLGNDDYILLERVK
jgi:hypothetical protein